MTDSLRHRRIAPVFYLASSLALLACGGGSDETGAGGAAGATNVGGQGGTAGLGVAGQPGQPGVAGQLGVAGQPGVGRPVRRRGKSRGRWRRDRRGVGQPRGGRGAGRRRQRGHGGPGRQRWGRAPARAAPVRGGGGAGGGTAGRGGSGAAGRTGTLRIMPLGDSTTGSVCYRAQLWKLLNDAGYQGKFDFVGSRKNDPGCGVSGYDQDNEGHPSVLVTNFINDADDQVGGTQTPETLLGAHPADVVLFHFATNDMWNEGIALDKVLAAYTRVLTALRQANPNVTVLVAQLIPMAVTASPARAAPARPARPASASSTRCWPAIRAGRPCTAPPLHSSWWSISSPASTPPPAWTPRTASTRTPPAR